MLGEYAIKNLKFDKSYEFNSARTYSTCRLTRGLIYCYL